MADETPSQDSLTPRQRAQQRQRENWPQYFDGAGKPLRPTVEPFNPLTTPQAAPTETQPQAQTRGSLYQKMVDLLPPETRQSLRELTSYDELEAIARRIDSLSEVARAVYLDPSNEAGAPYRFAVSLLDRLEDETPEAVANSHHAPNSTILIDPNRAGDPTSGVRWKVESDGSKPAPAIPQPTSTRPANEDSTAPYYKGADAPTGGKAIRGDFPTNSDEGPFAGTRHRYAANRTGPAGGFVGGSGRLDVDGNPIFEALTPDDLARQNSETPARIQGPPAPASTEKAFTLSSDGTEALPKEAARPTQAKIEYTGDQAPTATQKIVQAELLRPGDAGYWKQGDAAPPALENRALSLSDGSAPHAHGARLGGAAGVGMAMLGLRAPPCKMAT